MKIPQFMYAFCADKDHPRTEITRPFDDRGYVWATNGHIIVRVKGPTSNRKGPLLTKIPIHKLGRLPSHGGIEITASILNPYRKDFVCKLCLGSGVDEDGEECPRCDGLKYRLEKCWQLDKDNVIGIVPLMKIIENLGPTTFFPDGLRGGPIPFRSDKAVGFLMPLRGGPRDHFVGTYILNKAKD